VHDHSLRRILRTDKKNSETTVVWNPWIEGAASLNDFGPDEWQHMICVEASNVLRCPVALEAGEEHSLRGVISLLPA
jgi:glucose-6-phosphate 1-epimerase